MPPAPTLEDVWAATPAYWGDRSPASLAVPLPDALTGALDAAYVAANPLPQLEGGLDCGPLANTAAIRTSLEEALVARMGAGLSFEWGPHAEASWGSPRGVGYSLKPGAREAPYNEPHIGPLDLAAHTTNEALAWEDKLWDQLCKICFSESVGPTPADEQALWGQPWAASHGMPGRS